MAGRRSEYGFPNRSTLCRCRNIDTRSSFPPVRACIFDMDGLLIDSEVQYTIVTNTILHEYGRPSLPWNIKATLQGRSGPQAGKIFYEWAQLPISEDEFMGRQKELQKEAFKKCKPLPGVESLLRRLVAAKPRVRLAVATSSHRANYEIKTKGMKEMFKAFPESQIVVGDDERIPTGRGKPLPDIYLLALKAVNETMKAEGAAQTDIKPDECLVFEDSVTGVEAGRRAGMRVVWCPHEGLLGEYRGREKEVLAGQMAQHKEDDVEMLGTSKLEGSPGHVGEIDDGWAEMLHSLEYFVPEKYGIDTEGGRKENMGVL